MASIDPLFVTRLYRTELTPAEFARLNPEIAAQAALLAEHDRAGRRWCRKNHYPGYTSYASLDDLPWRFPAFRALARITERHAAAFARALDFDLGAKKLKLDSIWVNVLAPGGAHSSHIHPQAVISGVYYVATPPGASALKLEDPRLPLMMAAPPKRAKAAAENRAFVYVTPKPGALVMWESWLRHEVPVNQARAERVSVSFNLRWG